MRREAAGTLEPAKRADPHTLKRLPRARRRPGPGRGRGSCGAGVGRGAGRTVIRVGAGPGAGRRLGANGRGARRPDGRPGAAGARRRASDRRRAVRPWAGDTGDPLTEVPLARGGGRRCGPCLGWTRPQTPQGHGAGVGAARRVGRVGARNRRTPPHPSQPPPLVPRPRHPRTPRLRPPTQAPP